MNELSKVIGGLEACKVEDISKQVMSVCRAITPQFYKNLTLEDMKAEKLGIELLVADIDQKTLAEMCKRAVLNYPLTRSQNNKIYFDINYILEFYEASFNFVHSESVELSNEAVELEKYIDFTKNIVYQTWLDNGVTKKTANIFKPSEGVTYDTIYSLKDFERLQNAWK